MFRTFFIIVGCLFILLISFVVVGITQQRNISYDAFYVLPEDYDSSVAQRDIHVFFDRSRNRIPLGPSTPEQRNLTPLQPNTPTFWDSYNINYAVNARYTLHNGMRFDVKVYGMEDAEAVQHFIDSTAQQLQTQRIVYQQSDAALIVPKHRGNSSISFYDVADESVVITVTELGSEGGLEFFLSRYRTWLQHDQKLTTPNKF